RLDVGNPHVEQDPALIPGAAADATVDHAPVPEPAAVHEPVMARLRDLLGDRVARRELPPEQVAVIALELLRVAADDLEVHHCVSHAGGTERRRETHRGSELSL